jgi:hypothetical protein
MTERFLPKSALNAEAQGRKVLFFSTIASLRPCVFAFKSRCSRAHTVIIVPAPSSVKTSCRSAFRLEPLMM